MSKYQIGPKPTDLLPPAPTGFHWEYAFFDMENTELHYTVDFNGRRFKYRLVENAHSL